MNNKLTNKQKQKTTKKQTRTRCIEMIGEQIVYQMLIENDEMKIKTTQIEIKYCETETESIHYCNKLFVYFCILFLHFTSRIEKER